MVEENKEVALLSGGEHGTKKPKAKMARHRASVVTRMMAYLSKESPAYGTYIIGFLTVNSRIDYAPFFATVKERLLKIPKFRSVYKVQWKSAFYEIEEEEMDFDYHFQVAMEGHKPTLDEVTAYISEKLERDHLDAAKPLW